MLEDVYFAPLPGREMLVSAGHFARRKRCGRAVRIQCTIIFWVADLSFRWTERAAIPAARNPISGSCSVNRAPRRRKITRAAMWYRRSPSRADSLAQYRLGCSRQGTGRAAGHRRANKG